MNYGDKLPPRPWYVFTPPRRYIFTPPLTSFQRLVQHFTLYGKQRDTRGQFFGSVVLSFVSTPNPARFSWRGKEDVGDWIIPALDVGAGLSIDQAQQRNRPVAADKPYLPITGSNRFPASSASIESLNSSKTRHRDTRSSAAVSDGCRRPPLWSIRRQSVSCASAMVLYWSGLSLQAKWNVGSNGYPRWTFRAKCRVIQSPKQPRSVRRRTLLDTFKHHR